jgi:HK97 family phage major capsid protein
MISTVTNELREFLAKNHGLEANATESRVRELAGQLVMSEAVSIKQIKELTAGPANRIADMVKSQVAEATKGLSEQIIALTGLLTKATDVSVPAAATVASADAAVDTTTPLRGFAANSPRAAMLAGAGSGDNVRVKSALEDYDDSHTAAIYGQHSKNEFLRKSFGNRQVVSGEPQSICYRPMNIPSQRDKAKAGAWFKFMLLKSGYTGLRMTEHDWQIVNEVARTSKFMGSIGYTNDDIDNAQWELKGERLGDIHIKALLDDSASGGSNAVPVEFDDVAVITPLLNGELFPLVKTRTVTRRQIVGLSVTNPTMTWSATEGTDIPVFDTSSFMGAFNTNVFPVTGCIEEGLDFEDDSPVPVGEILISRYGQSLAKELDKVIPNGDGTTQPQGLKNSGMSAVSSGSGTGGPWLVSDFENLMLSVGKEYRDTATREQQVFISNETTYNRTRAISVNSSSDQRRVFGMDEESYRLFNHPYKVQNDIANTYAYFANLSYYRMYRRLGFTVRTVTESKDLARQNKRLIVIRARFGGQLELAGAGRKITDGKS